MTTWYEINHTNPTAVTKAGQLKEFYVAFREEYANLLDMHAANKDVLQGGDTSILQEAQRASDDIESKMRRLKAMGFE